MVSQPLEILAEAIEQDAIAHESGQHSTIGIRWDEIYQSILPSRKINAELIDLAIRFWDDWGDAANHDWKYHHPLKKDDWPILAREIAVSLRRNKLPANELILDNFLSRPKQSLFFRIRRLFEKNV